MLRVVAWCSPGLESFVQRECAALGVVAAPSASGKIVARATQRQVFEMNLRLRCADRVVVETKAFRATSFADLEVGLKWLRTGELAPFVAGGGLMAVRVSTTASNKLYHKQAIKQRVRAAFGSFAPALDDKSDEDD